MIITETHVKADGCEVFTIPHCCYICGERLIELPLFMWSGFGDQIWMHVECARKFSQNINLDIESIW